MAASVAFPSLLLLLLLHHQILVPVNAASFNWTRSDQEALLSFRRLIISDPSNALSSWKENSTFCNWEGVSCDPRKQRVTDLDLQNLRLTGTISPRIGNLSFLRVLHLQNNRFTGTLPDQISNLMLLRVLNARSNSFQGPIPPNITRCSNLMILDLTANQFSGRIPLDLGRLSKLRELKLGHNQISGILPSSLANLSSLTTLNLSMNSLSGPLLSEIENLDKLEVMDVSDNQLSSTIPESIGKCGNLQALFMAKNLFSGFIPESLGELEDLKILDLSSNQLSGAIPNVIWELQALQLLNLSFNDLQGEVPKGGDFSNLPTADLSRNMKPCQLEANQEFGACNTGVSNSLVLTIVLSITGFIIICLVIIGSAWIYVLIKTKKTAKVEAIESFSGRHIMVSYEEISFVTGSFSTDNLIGTGSLCSVYRGRVQDGTQVAIKVFNLQQHGSFNSFLAESEALRNIRHRNIVNLITSCSTTDSKNGEFRALVFELVPNGRNLEKSLHYEKQHGDGFQLNLIERLDIAIDIASAMYYLHHDSETTVVHCDLKPSNVLLCSDKRAKIGNFGLARLINERLIDQQSSMRSLQGSIGYIAPEYGIGGKPSTKGDVYSYGIMLLELFTGKSPNHETFTNDVSIQKWVDTNFPDNIMDIVDLELQPMEDLSVNGRTISWKRQEDCLVSVIGVGLSCVVESPDQRASMRDVVPKLKGIKRALEGHVPRWVVRGASKFDTNVMSSLQSYHSLR